MLGNTFIVNQFNYASLIWIFCQRTLYFEMERIHHKTTLNPFTSQCVLL